jgi:hypothetical protein
MHLTLATACMHTGDYCRADRSLQSFQQYAEYTDTLKKAIPLAHRNKAVLMQCMKRAGADIPLYQVALAAYQADGRYEQVLRCRVDLAWSFLLSGIVTAGSQELAACNDITLDDVEAELLHDYRIAQALLLRLQGDIQKSTHLITQELREPDLTPGQQAELLWMMALNAQSVGNAELAWHSIEQARKFAVDEWWPPLLERVEAVRQALLANRVGR